MTTPIPPEPPQAPEQQYADQRAHDVSWMTAAEREVTGAARRPAAAASLPKDRAVASENADDALTMVPDTGDEPARMLAEHGTPEKLLGYRLTEAERRKREAYSAALAQRDADGKMPSAEHRYVASYEAAHAAWTAEAASAVARYAREIGATAPAASSAADDPTLPYNQGWHNGADMLIPEILAQRPSGYSDSQWREFVAGYAEASQLHAEATARYARTVQELAARQARTVVPPWAAAAPGPVEGPRQKPAAKTGQHGAAGSRSQGPDPRQARGR